jgi:2,4-dienoyl-CoA reductase-like NADH-dependent reductase (Old Yellow Enzyme family)/thioredoxin reductase
MGLDTRFPNLFSPFTIKNMTLRNRVCSTAHFAEWMADDDGLPNREFVAYMAERAQGGIGLVTTGATVTLPGSGPGYLQNIDDRFIEGYRTLANAVHEHGASLIAQLLHAGDQAPVIGKVPVARLRLGEYLPIPPVATGTPPPPVSPPMRDWTLEQLREISSSFAEGARRAEAGGVDGVELHAHERYLLAQFLSPFYNRRSDSYGGTLENRARLVIEILEEIRNKTGDDFVVGVRLKARDFHPEGMVETDCIRLIEFLQSRDLVDYVSLTGGTDQIHMGPMYLADGALLPMIGDIKRAVDVPVVHAGRITDPVMAEQALANGQVDLVGMTKAHIADPHLINKLASGTESEIRPCVRCLHCLEIEPVTCIYNPLTGRESEWSKSLMAATAKRVVIIGAGPAGMETALTAAKRGHEVTVLEKSDLIGGQIMLAGAGQLRKKILEIADFYDRQARSGLFEIQTGIEVNAETIESFNPDAVIVATGSIPRQPKFTGTKSCKIVTVREIVEQQALVGNRALIVDRLGEHHAFVAADVLRLAQNTVKYITPRREVGGQLGARNGGILYEKLNAVGVEFAAGLDVTRNTEEGVVVQDMNTGHESIYGHFDVIVFAEEENPSNQLVSILTPSIPFVRAVGAANGNPSIRSATLDGALIGREI